MTQSKFNPFKREIVRLAYSGHVHLHRINWLAKRSPVRAPGL